MKSKYNEKIEKEKSNCYTSDIVYYLFSTLKLNFTFRIYFFMLWKKVCINHT